MKKGFIKTHFSGPELVAGQLQLKQSVSKDHNHAPILWTRRLMSSACNSSLKEKNVTSILHRPGF